jgi:exodeoxyribonuclease VII large subunit
MLRVVLMDEDARDQIPILSVADISKNLRQVVERNFAFVKIRGEVSGFKLHTSGHMYFSLKDPTSDAVLNSVCWRGTKISVKIADGMEIIAEGHLSVYPGRSNYQLVVSEASHAGEGALLKLLAARKTALAAAGLFERRRPLPKFPRVVGVVTSPTGAVIRDIIHRISDRFPCRVVVWPVLVQGTGAAEQISGAIAGFNSLEAENLPDVIIVARGGGSIEDLWPFNEECVVRAVFNSGIPVVSAVGHETDTTLVDFAADVRAPTPTAAAEMITPVRGHILADLLEKRNNMAKALMKTADTAKLRLQLHSVPSLANWIGNLAMRVDDLCERLQSALLRRLSDSKMRQENLMKRLLPPTNMMRLLETKLTFGGAALSRLASHITRRLDDVLAKTAIMLQQNSYVAILNKGFCFVADESGNGISLAADVLRKKPKRLALHFKDGVVFVVPE